MVRAGGRQWPGKVMAVACAALAGVAGCAPGDAGTHPARPVLPARAATDLGAGTLYLLLGSAAISANLWRVDLGTGRVRQLTFNPPQYGVSNFSASTAGLVLGDARTGVDNTEIMVRGKPRLLSGGVGDSPQINATGQIIDVAFAEQGVRHGPWSHDRLLYWTTPSSPYRTIYQAPPANLISVAWNPAGTLMLTAGGPADEAHTRLFAVDKQGRIIRTFLTIPGPSDGLAWGRYGLAVGYQIGNPSVVVSTSGQVLAKLPNGWIPGCWNPVSTRLLVTNRNRDRIGIWDPASPAQVRDLGRLPGGALRECAWTTRPAPGT